MRLSAQESKTQSRASGVSEENGANRPIVKRLWKCESQKSSSCRNCVRTVSRAINSKQRAIASGTPNSDADGQPSPEGANVLQMASSARRCLAERFMKRASVAEGAVSRRTSRELNRRSLEGTLSARRVQPVEHIKKDEKHEEVA